MQFYPAGGASHCLPPDRIKKEREIKRVKIEKRLNKLIVFRHLCNTLICEFNCIRSVFPIFFLRRFLVCICTSSRISLAMCNFSDWHLNIITHFNYLLHAFVWIRNILRPRKLFFFFGHRQNTGVSRHVL